MRLPSRKMIAFNAAAVLMIAGAFLTTVRNVFSPPQTAPCSTRYHATTSLDLDNKGQMLTTADLQSTLYGADRGVARNLTIERVKGGPVAFAMAVKLDQGTGPAVEGARNSGGVSFPWKPRSVQTQSAACLTYSMRLPADFDFGDSGTLPGLMGTSEMDRDIESWNDGFATPAIWGTNGITAIYASYITDGQKMAATLASRRSGIPRDRWVRVEQEVQLNTPGQDDGIIRLWVDGDLKVEGKGLAFRKTDAVKIAGVVSAVHHGSAEVGSVAPKDQALQLGPLELRWK